MNFSSIAKKKKKIRKTEKGKGNAVGPPISVPGSSIPVPEVPKLEVTTSDGLSSVPHDMEIGGEKLPGLPCQMR